MRENELGHQVIEAVDSILPHRAEQVDREEEVGGGDAAPPPGVQVVWHLAQQRGPVQNKHSIIQEIKSNR